MIARSHLTARSIVGSVFLAISATAKPAAPQSPLPTANHFHFHEREMLAEDPFIWFSNTVLDRSRNTEDLLIDSYESPPTPATCVPLGVVGSPPGISAGVAEFTIFGPPHAQIPKPMQSTP